MAPRPARPAFAAAWLLAAALGCGAPERGADGAAAGASGAPPAAAAAAAAGAPAADATELRREYVSGPILVDRIFRSMLGPVFVRRGPLEEGAAPELLWLTGYAMSVLAEDGKTPASIEYECHSNLGWPKERPEGFRRPSDRVFTLTQGQVDVRLPEGFGIPVLSNEDLGVFSQVLNLSQPTGSRRVRHRLEVRYRRDRDLAQPPRPLVVTHAFVMTTLDEEPAVYNVAAPGPELEGASCQAGSLPPGVRGSYVDRNERRFTGHWVLPRGRSEYHTLVTDQMAIPYDTTVHFIGVHVHPFSESLELRDLTAGRSVWKGAQKSSAQRRGLDWIELYASEEGIPIHADHQYELVSVYRNPSGERTDAMAAMFLYYEDREFDRAAVLARLAGGGPLASAPAPR